MHGLLVQVRQVVTLLADKTHQALAHISRASQPHDRNKQERREKPTAFEGNTRTTTTESRDKKLKDRIPYMCIRKWVRGDSIF